MSEYEQKAQQFLKETETEFKAEFIKNGLYFDDDKELRDIYKITLKKGNREFSFMFGQSLNDSGFKAVRKDGVIFNLGFEKEINQTRDKERFIRECINHFGSLNGIEIKKPKEPTAYDFLSSVEKYEYTEFKDFCSSFGYDEDSRKAEKTFKAVKEEYKKIAMLYNDEEIEKLQEIN